MKILKFGGVSVGSAENLFRIKDIIQSEKENYILVVSAFSQVTNALQKLSHDAVNEHFIATYNSIYERHFKMIDELGLNHEDELINWVKLELNDLKLVCEGVSILGELTPKSTARILAKGELLSSRIIHSFLTKNNIQTEWLDSRHLIRTDSNYLNAAVDFVSTSTQCQSHIKTHKNYTIPGFIAQNDEGKDTLLGRGGSDYTATIVGNVLNAEQIELWSDVSGLMNADPRVVSEAKPIHEMSYEEAFEMSYFGAKVLYPPAIQPAMEKNIVVYLKNTMQPEHVGTKIHDYRETERGDKVLGVSTLKDISVYEISGVGLAQIGSAAETLKALSDAKVNVILISQSCSEQSICIAVKSEDALRGKKALENSFKTEIEKGWVNPIDIRDKQVILALVGDQMKSQVGLSGKIFSALGENDINVRAIAQGASERNISIVIGENDAHKAVNVVHERFFQDVIKKINLFVIGAGNVGKEFLSMVENQRNYCQEQFKAKLNVALLANSKQFIFNEKGLSNDQINSFPKDATPYTDLNQLQSKIVQANLPNSIVVDNTASEKVSELYADFFKHSISVATCNKIASSSPYDNYQNLMQLTKQHNCNFQYETTVGASLPVIRTIQDLKLSGDAIQKIQAVLSGSLNFIFNHYNGTKPFVDVVKDAMEGGYTEPDPRIDLSGLDVRRKLLILARESGRKINLDAIQFNSFLPPSTEKAKNVDEFLSILEQEETFFQNMYKKAEENNARLKVIAEMDGDNYKVSLQEVKSESPIYNLDGKDNIVALTTQFYQPEPLVVKGAGAGAKVTASGVLADVMYVVNRGL